MLVDQEPTLRSHAARNEPSLSVEASVLPTSVIPQAIRAAAGVASQSVIGWKMVAGDP